MTVLILAQEADAPTDALVRALTQREVPVFRADTSWFPQVLHLDAELDGEGRWSGVLWTEHRSVELGSIRSIWYRDPSAFTFPPSMSPVERAYAHREARLGLGGVLAALPVCWVNHPNRAADAIYKPLQLSTAARCGLTVAPSLVTNAPEAAHRFATKCRSDVVVKSFGPNTITEGDALKVAFTHRLTAAEMKHLPGAAVTATQLQQWVDKTREARVVVVGSQVFTILIHAKSAAARLDWRADFGALSYEWVEAPPHVEKGLRRYQEALGLVYSACDFAIDADGRWVFLESNSSGQYGWLEAQTGAPITAAIADLLATGAAA